MGQYGVLVPSICILSPYIEFGLMITPIVSRVALLKFLFRNTHKSTIYIYIFFPLQSIFYEISRRIHNFVILTPLF